MKRLALGLLLGALIAAPVAAGVTIHMARLNGIQYLDTDAALCPAGAACIYRDTADSKLKAHLPDNSVLLLGGALTANGVECTQKIGANLQGVDAANNNYSRITPSESGSPKWMEWEGAFLCDSQDRCDHVMRRGWNIGGGGGLFETGTRKGALADEYETYFEGGSNQMERHWVYVDPIGGSHRLMSTTSNLDSPYNSIVYITSEGGVLGAPPAGNTPAFVWTTDQIEVDAKAGRRVFANDDQVWLEMGNGKLLALNSSQAALSGLPLFVGNVTEPSTPSGGGVLWVQGGALKFKGSSGTLTTLGPP